MARQRIQNMDKLMAKLNAMPEGVDRELTLELARAAVEIRDGARRRVPKVTRRLHDSLWVWKRGKKFRIGTRSIYAQAIEFGTRFTTAQPFLLPAFNEVVKKLRPGLIGAVDRSNDKLRRR